MKTLIEFENNSTDFTPLRLIVAGSAGCGKSYLIKCLVKAVKMFYNFNKSVQVLCPTGNRANLISGVTIHSFFKIPTSRKSKDFKAPDGDCWRNIAKQLSGVESSFS
jgi:energy-coupling factor transporter ATP-binding protein EcfA2